MQAKGKPIPRRLTTLYPEYKPKPQPRRKLAEDVICAIYTAAWNGENQYEIARRFDVPQSMVSAIKTRKKYRRVTASLHKTQHVARKRSGLPHDIVIAIYRDAWESDLTQKQIAERYAEHGVNRDMVKRIKNHADYAKVTMHVTLNFNGAP